MKTERSANALAARKISTAGIAAIACAAILVVAPPGDATAARVFPSLQRAGSCAVVRGAIADAVADRAYQRLLRSRRHRHYRLRERLSRRKSRAGGRPMKRAMPMASAESPTDAARGPSHHTGTNNQVADVHEADQVKTDGKTIYAIAGREVLIIKSWPVSATRVLSRYRVGSGETPTSLFVHGKRLVVISRHRTTRGGSSLRCRHTTKGFRRPHRCAPHNVYTTRVSVIDVADRRNPRALAHVDLDGRLLSARRIGREMAFVTSAPLHIPRKIWSDLRHVQSPKRSQGPRHRYFYRWDGMGRPHRVTPPKTPPTAHQPASWSNLRRRALQALRATPIVDILPHATFFSASGGKLASRTMQRCGEIFVPRETAGLNLLSVTRLSLDGGRVASAGVLASGTRVYASKKRVYIASPSRPTPTWRHPRKRRPRWRSPRGTMIHAFTLGHTPRYVATGGVPGYLLNQFAMDEHQGYLRVATTQNGWGSQHGGRAGNGIFVLAPRGGHLVVVGSLQGLAPGERIYAARMFGPQGYLVTFRRTDPLYTLDLSNPRAPRVLGELKVNGFSTYIHPLAQRRLLTVGQDGTTSGRTLGAQLQIFDVRDPQRPKRTHRLLLNPHGRSTTLARYDHHAFTYDPRSRLLALPLSATRNGQRFNGVALVRADGRRGFARLGTIDHSDLLPTPPAVVGWRCPKNARCRPASPTRRRSIPKIRRTFFIDHYLFTVSRAGIEAHDVASPRLTQVVTLPFASR